MNKIGELSQEIKDYLKGNLHELSKVEGNILSSAKGKEVKTIYVTSCGDAEGKTITALSLAYALAARSNLKVLLVDGNLHAPQIYKLFHVEGVCGLADLLLSTTGYEEAFRKTEYESLTIVPHGNKVSSTTEVFRTDKFKDRLDALRQKFDYVIFDGHAVFSSSDAAIIARYFDGIVFVVECEKTNWAMFRDAREKLEMAGGSVLGVVLNKRKYYIPKILYGKI